MDTTELVKKLLSEGAKEFPHQWTKWEDPPRQRCIRCENLRHTKGDCSTLLRLALEQQKVEIERLLGERQAIAECFGGHCNGCGKPIKGFHNLYRCVTQNCGRIYHRECLLTHCAQETAELVKERDRLKEDLRILTEGRFIQS